MTREPGAGGPRRQGPKAAPSTSGHDRHATKARLALPGDLGRSLRLLHDDALDRLVKAAIEEARWDEHDVPQDSLDESRQSKRLETKSRASDRAGAVTPGQKRLIPAAQEAGLKPAAIARECRLSRPTVKHAIIAAPGARRSDR